MPDIYQIKTYQPWMVPQQVKLGQKVTSHWNTYYQSDAATLQETYQQDDFDPDTRFYLIDKDEKIVVGFLTCKIEDDTAIIAPPIVENDNYELITELFSHSLQEFRKRNVSNIRLTTSDNWGSGFQLVDDFNLQKERSLFLNYQGDLQSQLHHLTSKYPTNLPDTKIELFKPEHRDDVAKILSRIIGYSEEFAKSILEPTAVISDRNTISFTLSVAENVVGWIRGELISTSDKSKLSISPGYMLETEDQKYRAHLIRALLEHVSSTCDNLSEFDLIVTARTAKQFDPDLFPGTNLKQEIAYYTKKLEKINE